MSTRKAVKKATKNAAKKKVTVRPAAAAAPVMPPPAPEPIPIPAPDHVVTAVPVQETFVTTPEPAPATSVPRTYVLVLINGSNYGNRPHNDRPMAEFARGLAAEFGIRTFSVYLDGVKANTSMGNTSMGNFGKIEIVSKDSRG